MTIESLRSESPLMPVSKPNSLEAALNALLAAHFDNCENPHETISRIWLLLNAQHHADNPSAGTDGAKPTYN